MKNYNSVYEKMVARNLIRYSNGGKFKRRMAGYMHFIIRVLFNCDICLDAQIGSGLIIPHAVGIVIGATAVIGNNVVIMPNVVIGATHYPPQWDKKRHATIEDGVIIGANTVILGDIIIGKQSIIGANSIITKDVPPYSIVVGCGSVVGEKLERNRK